MSCNQRYGGSNGLVKIEATKSDKVLSLTFITLRKSRGAFPREYLDIDKGLLLILNF